MLKPWKQPELPLVPGNNTSLINIIEKGLSEKKLEKIAESKDINKDVGGGCVSSDTGFNFVGLNHYEVGYYRHLIFGSENTSMMQVNKRVSNSKVQSTKNNINQINMEIKSVPCFMKRDGKYVFVRTELYLNEKISTIHDKVLSKDAGKYFVFSGFRYRYLPKNHYMYRYGDRKKDASLIPVEEYMEEAAHMVEVGQINKDKSYSCINSDKTVNYLDIVEDYTDYFDYFFIPSGEIITSQIREQIISEKYNSYYYESTQVRREGIRHVCYKCLQEDHEKGVCIIKRRVVSVYHPNF
ncbi:hypothetical protein [Bacteriovorax sp. BSW11_IV]|uniref:hypothetical protein n=1 Tax=Bacteriovorax sp. BSW11_IV TaxID=1353529 RepID=UPI0012DCA027|nr:hypothetical protein [Bacteriovorax sp. BSW11_IV]